MNFIGGRRRRMRRWAYGISMANRVQRIRALYVIANGDERDPNKNESASKRNS